VYEIVKLLSLCDMKILMPTIPNVCDSIQKGEVKKSNCLFHIWLESIFMISEHLIYLYDKF